MKMNCAFTVFVVLVLVAYAGSFPFKGNDKLYDANGPVIIADANSFNETFFFKDHAFFIQFFASWCGHCQEFKNVYVELAHDVYAWRNVIALGGVDCAQEQNRPLCQYYGVGGFPTLKFFEPDLPKSEQSAKAYAGGRSVAVMAEGIVTYVQSLKDISEDWPNLNPFASNDMRTVFDGFQSSVESVGLVFEKEGSFVGRKLILDFWNVRDFFRMRSVTALNDLARFLKVDTLPTLVILDRQYNSTLINAGVSKDDKKVRNIFREQIEAHAVREYNRLHGAITHSDGRQLVRELIFGKFVNATHSVIEQEGTKATSAEIDTLYSEDLLHLADLESALHYTFRAEVPEIALVQGEMYTTLRNLVSVLVKFYPGMPWTMDYLRELEKLMSTRTSLTSAEWLKYMNYITTKKRFLSNRTPYVGCVGSRSFYRGYPCSMWMLFHTMSVSHYRTRHSDNNYDMHLILKTMRDYILDFFSCRTCADNFRTESRGFHDDVHTSEEAVLWLWRTHNSVNYRLSGHESDDPHHPKTQFPPKSLCPECRSDVKSSQKRRREAADNQAEFSNALLPDIKINWNETEVLDFLLDFYDSRKADTTSSSTIKDGEIMWAAVHGVQDRSGVEPPPVSGGVGGRHDSPVVMGMPSWTSFGLLDMSLCVTLYVSSIFILVAIYFLIVMKRRYRGKNA